MRISDKLLLTILTILLLVFTRVSPAFTPFKHDFMCVTMVGPLSFYSAF